jgi:hypothetical protein
MGKIMRCTITVFTLLSAATSLAGGHIESKCYVADGTVWVFEVYTDQRDEWDSSVSEHPPLSPKKAKDVATAFMKRVPFGDKMRGWSLSTITLRHMSGDRLPEHWIY